jgi:hypothetical protein
MSRGKVLCAVAALGLCIGAISALAKTVDPVAYCHSRLSVMGRKFFHQWSGEISLCQQRRMDGQVGLDTKCYPDEFVRVDTTTYCETAVDPQVDPYYERRLCRAEQHSHEKIKRKCEDDYLSQFELGVPCGTVATVARLQDCIDFDAHGQNAINFTRTVYGSVGRVADDHLRTCMVTIFETGQVYARKVMKTVGDKCELFVSEGKLSGPCPDKASQKQLKKARRIFAESVLAACTDDLAAHRVPFGPPCNNLANPTPSDYVDCLASAAEAEAMRGVETVWMP